MRCPWCPRLVAGATRKLVQEGRARLDSGGGEAHTLPHVQARAAVGEGPTPAAGGVALVLPSGRLGDKRGTRATAPRAHRPQRPPHLCPDPRSGQGSVGWWGRGKGWRVKVKSLGVGRAGGLQRHPGSWTQEGSGAGRAQTLPESGSGARREGGRGLGEEGQATAPHHHLAVLGPAAPWEHNPAPPARNSARSRADRRQAAPGSPGGPGVARGGSRTSWHPACRGASGHSGRWA